MIINSSTISGHFGEFIQGRFDRDGSIVLITVPNLEHKATVVCTPDPFKVEQIVTQSKPKELVSKVFYTLNHSPKGQFRISLDMPECYWLGSSTAARVGLFLSINPDLSPEFLAQSCINQEGASDPLMFSKPEKLLWAPRQGKIIRNLPKLPRIMCSGGLFGILQRTDPLDLDLQIISDLITEWESLDKIPIKIGEICSDTSDRTLKLKGHDDVSTKKIRKELGALVYSIVRTGTVRNFIFPHVSVPKKVKNFLEKARFMDVRQFSLGLH